MYMKNWEEKLDAFLRFTGRNILNNAGNVTKEFADKLAIEQYFCDFQGKRHGENKREASAELSQSHIDAGQDAKWMGLRYAGIFGKNSISLF